MLISYFQHLFIEILILCLVLYAGTACWYLFSSVTKKVEQFRPGPTLLMFVGLWFISCIGMLARLVGPLSSSFLPWIGLLLLGGCCLLVWLVQKHKLPRMFSSLDRRNLLLVCLLLIPFNTGEWGWDAGLYHMSKGLHFLNTENITGIALLNTRFGFNPLTDIWHALFLGAGAGNFAFYVLNEFFLVILALFLLEFSTKSEAGIGSLAVLIFTVLFIAASGTVNFTDRGVADFTALALTSMGYMCLFILVLSTNDTGTNPDAQLRVFAAGGLIVVLACMVKVNSAPLFVFLLFWWLAQCLRKKFVRSGLILFLLASVSGVLWLYTNYLISGCWLYPADFTCPVMDHAQTVGRAAAQYELEVILTHARAPVVDPPMAFLTLGRLPDWYLAWWSANKSFPYTWGIIVGICGSALLILYGAFRRAPGLHRYVLLWASLGLHTLYWWVAAPALRYALFLPFMWVVLFGLLITLVFKLDFSRIQGLQKMQFILIAGLFFGVLSSNKMFSTPSKVPQASLIPFTSDAGFSFDVAAPDIRCWDAPLPCSSGMIFDWASRIDYFPARGFFLHPSSQ